MKKLLLILLFLIIIGAGATGTIYYYIQNKNQIQLNQTLSAQNSNIQAQLNAIGTLTTVYEVSTKVYSGNPILETELVPVSVPLSTCADSSIQDINQLIGRCYRVDINPGTILSTDMLMEETDGTKEKYPREITLTSVPVSTVVGDYIDLRILLPNGEEYVIFSHKKIQRMYGTTLTFFFSEEENAILNSALNDYGNYGQYCIIYAMKYLEPGNDTDTVAFYPVTHDVENFIKFNPNIKDPTRCINENLRNHIDEVFLVFTDSMNQSVASSFISNVSSQFSSQLSAHQEWVAELTDEEGNFHPENDTVGSNSSNSNVSYDEAVGEAMDDIESGFEDLGEIQ